jgi:transposase
VQEERQLLMTQADRDRLLTLKQASKNVITQVEAAAELQVSVGHVKRMLKRQRDYGDGAVVHGLRGRESNRKIDTKVRDKAVKILSRKMYRRFGPTLASEHLAKKHGIEVSRETLRNWMQAAGLWKGRRQWTGEVHAWRQRRSRCGELVQWDTSNHDWLEGRGKQRLYLIHMIDDATSRLYARFVSSDSTEENMRTLPRIPGAIRQASGVLHRQSEPVPHDREAPER